jgi:hypothetical protein
MRTSMETISTSDGSAGERVLGNEGRGKGKGKGKGKGHLQVVQEPLVSGSQPKPL